jgi:hypothetical protein
MAELRRSTARGSGVALPPEGDAAFVVLQVTGGIDAIDAIEAVETDSAAKPRDPIVTERVELPG